MAYMVSCVFSYHLQAQALPICYMQYRAASVRRCTAAANAAEYQVAALRATCCSIILYLVCYAVSMKSKAAGTR
eukprot:12091-Heterococcus_DN1.PRE.9